MITDRLADIAGITSTAPVTKTDILAEATVGQFGTIHILSPEQVIGVLAARAKTVNQQSGDLSALGVGKYGLLLHHLQTVGVVKPHIDPLIDIGIVLNDPSVFTGKQTITNLDVLLNNAQLQRKLMQEAIISTVSKVISKGNELDSSGSTALIAGAAAGFALTDIITWIASGAEQSITDAAKNAHYAVALVDNKVTDEINTVRAGVTGAVVITPLLATGTLDTASITTAVNTFTSDSRLERTVVEFKGKESGDIF